MHPEKRTLSYEKQKKELRSLVASAKVNETTFLGIEEFATF